MIMREIIGFKLHVCLCMYGAQSCPNAYCYSCIEKEMSTLFFILVKISDAFIWNK